MTDIEKYYPNKSNYNYIHKPDHYCLFTVEDLKELVKRNEGIDVVVIANKADLDKDAYMFNVLKYCLRKNKPNEPRSRDVKKIREYCDIWLDNNSRKHPEQGDKQYA